ncbi:MAG: histidine kinase [Gordonia sp. (in: high G+C Gram-positive bacteria)]
MVGLGLIAAVAAGAVFVRYRERETHQLRAGAELARELRALAGDDAVRLAAVDEYETTLYQRLFSVSVVAPRVRSAVWSLLGAVLAAGGVLATRGDGILLESLRYAALVLALVFGLSALYFAGLAAVHSLTTPRVSFAESYAAAGADVPVTEASASADTGDGTGADSSGEPVEQK